MMPVIPNSGDLCVTIWRFGANRVNDMGETEVYAIRRNEHFIMIDCTEIEENNVLEFNILFENMKMWFNIYMSEHVIDGSRSESSYDIPFMTIQEPDL